MARLFVAVWPPAAVRKTLTALPVPIGPDLRRVPASNLHVTLRFLGDADAEQVAARLAAAPLGPATATLGPTLDVLGARVVIAPVTGLDALAAAVVAATGDLGEPPAARPFVGHVTLARARGRTTVDALTGTAVRTTPVSGDFQATSVAVVSSATHPDGARYTSVATVPVG